MRVLVCGGRDFADVPMMNRVLTKCKEENGIDVIIQGEAQGADRMARFWAEENGIEVEKYPALWHKYGKRAGYVRNQQMLDEGYPDLVVAFAGGRGTSMMVNLARNAGVRVMEIK